MVKILLVATLFFYAIMDPGLASGGRILKSGWNRAKKTYLLIETQDTEERLSKGINNFMLFGKVNE